MNNVVYTNTYAILLSLLISCLNISFVHAETAEHYNSVPPFITSGAPPLVMLVMGRDHKLYYEAYNDASDLNDDGVLDIRYNPEIDYYGYFDNHKCYTYSTTNKRFEPTSKTTDGKKCKLPSNDDWSGDFLNYLTMSRMDTMRKVLYGGYRSTDKADETVLERVFIPQDAHSWGKEYTSVAVDGYDIADYAPVTVPNSNRRHFFASTTRTSATSPPQLIYVLNQTDRIWNWIAKEAPVVNSRTNEIIREVRVKVCDPAVSLEANCQQYPNGNYKPIGILQRHGESLFDNTATPPAYKTPKMYFGLMTGSYAKSTSGGVLRKKIGNISDEIETNTDGTFKTTVNGIIQTINKLRIYGYNYSNKNYNLNCGWITNGPMTEGQCRDWGNPIAEIMYEAVRYFSGSGSPTSTFDYSGITDDTNLGLPKDTWNDPYDKSDCGFEPCAKPFMLVLSDINPSYDSNQLPGVNMNFGAGITSDLTGLDVSTVANTISSLEGINGQKFIGQSGSVSNGVCSEKTISGFESIRGLCPEEPTKLGSYYSASISNYALTTDLQSAVAGEQKVTTYAVGLASPLPRIELHVGQEQRIVTLVPFGKSVGNDNGSTSTAWSYKPTNTIVEFFVEEWTPTYGRFNISFEDVEQGADHDMDAIVRYEYQLVDAANTAVTDPKQAEKVKVTLTSTYASGSYIQHLGYIVSGTTSDGPYLVVRDTDTDPDLPTGTDTLPQSTYLPLTDTRYFTPSAGDSAAQLISNPLWYAAKWGAYEEKDGTSGPNLNEEWDKDNDGIPDTYFYVSNPLKLEEQLNKSFADILRRTTSGTAASVISGSRSGEGAIYQSVFYPEYSDNKDNSITWVGSVHASFIDEQGRMREDSNQNRILDKEDAIIVFRKQADGTLVIDKFELVDAVPEITEVTFPPASLFLAGKYFTLNAVGENFYVWFTVGGQGFKPPGHGNTGILVALDETDSAENVATKTAAAIDAYTAFSVSQPTANKIVITNTTPGDVTDASSATFSILVTQNGVGETTHLDFTGNAETIKYLWNSNGWLNSISDADIVKQRNYTSTDKQRYIFTFIDENENMIAEGSEQLPFISSNLPTPLELVDPATLFPYIPVYTDTTKLPAYPVEDKPGEPNSNRIKVEFLQNQAERIINYTRGLDQPARTIDYKDAPTVADPNPVQKTYTLPPFRSRKLDLDNNGTLETTWRLGDIVYSSPTVVNRPREALHFLYKDASYANFADKYKNRRTVLYVGANDGMLHAFNGGFYEDRFDVFPSAPESPDGIKDVQYLLQPIINTSNPGDPVVWGPDASISAHPLGSELWAYIPYNLLPHLYWPTEPEYKHVYFTDLKPRIFDAKIFPDNADHPGGWGTVLVGGMRFGGGKISVDMNKLDGTADSDDRTMGSAYFILDITNPEVPPTVLGEIRFPHLGYTTCYPTIATIKDKDQTSTQNNWYLVFGSGPAEADGSPGTTSGDSLVDAVSNQSAKIYVVDLVEMVMKKKLKTLNTGGALTEITPANFASEPGYYQNFTNDNNAFISDPITVDYDLDYKADAIYFGTESYSSAGQWGGKLRRIVINDDPSTAFWDGDSILLDLENSTTGIFQPISAAPTVGIDPDGNNWVFFGTGRYFIRNDKDITNQQSFYGVKEPKDSSDPPENSYLEVKMDKLYESTTIEVNTASKLVSGGDAYPLGPIPSSATVSWKDFVASTKSFSGWFYNFTDSLERNLGQAALYGDLATFTSYIPSNDICTYEGSSNLYALYYLTGTAPSNQAIQSYLIPNPTYHLKKISLGAGLVSKPSLHVGREDGSTVFVQTSEGAIYGIKQDNPGQTKSGRTSWGFRE